MATLSRWLGRGSCSAVLILALAGSGEAQERHILLLQSLDRGNLTLDYLAAAFRVDLASRATRSISFTQFVVNPSGLGAIPQQATVEYILAALADRSTPDLVMTIGGPAAAFARQHRQALFPDVPLLLAGVDQRFLLDIPPDDKEAVVAVANDFTAIVEDVIRLFPQTAHVFMLVGSGDLGRFWRPRFERDFRRFNPQISFSWSDDLSYTQILERVATLPPRSAIFHHSFGSDGFGAAYSEERVLADIHAVANAPIFGTQGAQMGRGIVGGRLMATDQLARSVADAVNRLLEGAAPSSVKIPVQQPGRPVFDWRELDRWGVSRSRLPADSTVLFEPPGVWERYKWVILTGSSALVAQTFLIATLLVSRVRRRRAEQAVRESEGRFRVLANATPAMVWLSGPDMLATDFNLPWLQFTGRPLDQHLGLGWLEDVHPDDADTLVASRRQACRHHEPIRTEYRLRRADGEYRWLLDIGHPRFTPDGTFSGYIGSAIDITVLKAARVALSQLNRRLMEAQEQERAHLARELHDDIGQRIMLLAIELEQLLLSLPERADDARVLVASLNEDVVTLGKDIQGISHRLHSAKLELLGIAAAAGSLCHELARQRGLKLDYKSENVPVRLPDGVALSLFRVLQEALSNAVKHSGGEHYRVALLGDGERVTLEVADDGVGFDVDAARRGQGIGLISMQERLGLVDGVLVIESTPGSGTTVRATVPVGAPAR